MVIPKSNQELTFMKKAGIIVALAHRAAHTAWNHYEKNQ